jgi:hypothetical protein
MTLFGGMSPEHDLCTPPDCMTMYVYEDLLHGFDIETAEDQASTPEGAFAWYMVFNNFAIVREVELPVGAI